MTNVMPQAPTVGYELGDVTIQARGPLSDAILGMLVGDESRADDLVLTVRSMDAVEDAIRDDDVQLSLFLIYAVSFGSLGQIGAQWEWDTRLIEARVVLERMFEAEVRLQVGPLESPAPRGPAVADALFERAKPTPGPSLSRYIARRADVSQVREHLALHSIYTLREADAHSWAIPRLTGRAKAALVEIQADEYGGGDPQRVHQVMYARTLRAAGLDDTYGRYVDAAPAITLAGFNLMTMFGMNRRLRGALVGHLAAFEMTSSIPSRFVAEGLRRLGFGDDVAAYYDEHVEADAVHEQIAARDMAGSLAEDEPALIDDIVFGAAACLAVEGWATDLTLERWEAGESALRESRIARDITGGGVL
nr:iron-containing redox enzyme family protein [Microbacterium paludicola]